MLRKRSCPIYNHEQGSSMLLKGLDGEVRQGEKQEQGQAVALFLIDMTVYLAHPQGFLKPASKYGESTKYQDQHTNNKKVEIEF